MSVLNNSNAIETGGYNIQRSLRFRSSASAYLSRTPASASNRKTWTWSGWVKLGTASVGTLFGHAVDSNNFELFQVLADGSIRYIVTIAGTNSGQRNTTRLLRDYSSWYHLVLSKDAASTAVNIYVNGGSAETSFSTSVAVANANGFINNTVQHRIGLVSGTGLTTNYFDGYLAEVNFIDGQALTPSSFGQTDPVTGVWTPKKYTGTYGTNGFYLPFTDNSSPTTLGYDKSGNGNNWTPNNISTTAGATYDSMLDVPTLTSATAANYCVLNPLQSASGVLSNANLTGALTANTDSTATFGLSSGKWYWEETLSAYNSGGNLYCGVVDTTYFGTNAGWSYSQAFVYLSTGQKGGNSSASSYGATYTTNDVIGVALDMDTGTIEFYKNGTSQGQAFNTNIAGKTLRPLISCGSGGTCTWQANFGQRPFSYTPPTGFKALNTYNLPDPTIKKPNQYMDATLYTGTGSALTVTNAGSFQPDLVWCKNRSAGDSHGLYDAVRGVNQRLISNLTNAEDTSSGVSAFNSNGFSLGTAANYNTNGNSFVGWQWKESATAGFDIVTASLSGTSPVTVNHSLGVAPKMIIGKIRSNTSNWYVKHSRLASNVDYYVMLNSTAAQAQSSNIWDGAPTSTSFVVGNPQNGWNGGTVGSANYVFYLFAEIAGFSKFGSYTGNGSTDGPFCYTGFRPSWILLKRTDTTGNWILLDNRRYEYNSTVSPRELYVNLSNAEADSNAADILSNGFKLRVNYSSYNANGGTYVYACFAENPFRYSLAR